MIMVVMILMIILMTICHRLPTYSCNEESCTLGLISEPVISHHRLWPLEISFIYVSERVGQKPKSPTARIGSNSKGFVTQTVYIFSETFSSISNHLNTGQCQPGLHCIDSFQRSAQKILSSCNDVLTSLLKSF